MIVSASRRTDIPALYPEWLRSRLRAGLVLVRHPFRASQVRAVDLRPHPVGALQALILWTRDPRNLLPDIAAWEAHGLRTLWLVTVTGYPRVLEPFAPDPEGVVDALRALAKRVGRDRIAWRYDPILLSPGLGIEFSWHTRNFRQLSEKLVEFSDRCIISCYTPYAKSARRIAAAGLRIEAGWDPLPVITSLAAEADRVGIRLQSCCVDLSAAGVRAGACIDGALLDRLWGLGCGDGADPGQRPGCRCAPSVDIGTYGTCTHGCLYCYATGSHEAALARAGAITAGAERLG